LKQKPKQTEFTLTPFKKKVNKLPLSPSLFKEKWRKTMSYFDSPPNELET